MVDNFTSVIAGHTSAATTALGLEADQAKWQAVHPGIEYKGAQCRYNKI